MFDVYGVIDFSEKRRIKDFENPFIKYEYYGDVIYDACCVNAPFAKIHFLERNGTSGGYFHLKHEHVLIFGSVFSSKKFASLDATKTRKLSAKDIYDMYKRFDRNLVNYIKGSFVLILYNETSNTLLLISDHLNVLPIFYAFRDGLFVFSSSIKTILDSGLVSANIDRTAIVELAIFDYTLGDKTFYEKIKMLDCGRILAACSDGIKQERYFCIQDLFQNRLYDKRDSLQMLSDVLHENANLYVSDAENFLLALTGGFDCRMNLSLLDRHPGDFLCYSYGMPGSRQLQVPMEIARRLSVNYVPILLNGHFEDVYKDYALRALFYSDGTAPVLRANYPYAYERLKEFSTVALTGLFGSEILRPIRNLGFQVNDNAKRLFTCRSFDTTLRDVCDDVKKCGYLREDIFERNYDELREHVWTNFFASDQSEGALHRFYNFFIEEGVRKYFMQEIKIERVYVDTRIPYFDFDFVSLIFRTPFAGLYNGALRLSPLGRRRAQSLYAYVIRRHSPILGEILTDRGYRPSDLLSRLWFFKISPGYIKSRYYYKKVGNDTFSAEHWTDLVFAQHHDLMRKETDLFLGTLYDKYKSGANMRENYYFSRMFSLQLWFEHVWA